MFPEMCIRDRVQTVVCAVTASCLVSLINRNYTTFCYFYKVAFGFSQEWLRKDVYKRQE